MPNNRPQAEQRALWLKGKLKQNMDLYNDYKRFMAYIIDEGYARKVPVDLQKSSNVREVVHTSPWGLPSPQARENTRGLRLFSQIPRQVA